HRPISPTSSFDTPQDKRGESDRKRRPRPPPPHGQGPKFPNTSSPLAYAWLPCRRRCVTRSRHTWASASRYRPPPSPCPALPPAPAAPPSAWFAVTVLARSAAVVPPPVQS